MLDTWARGRHKALGISKTDKLLEDALRDWSAVAQERLLVPPLSRFAEGRDIPLAEGILFRNLYYLPHLTVWISHNADRMVRLY
ncbi:strawberry notch-like NTP hydrolase domain-containing protein [Gemmobacter fulvus]|uniref:strawberry notch-like NTP hydrolase domain-containing protein n=1 Tax=Gemmobacter fulvus TaxID=2840474 RepID=UPI003F767652